MEPRKEKRRHDDGGEQGECSADGQNPKGAAESTVGLLVVFQGEIVREKSTDG